MHQNVPKTFAWVQQHMVRGRDGGKEGEWSIRVELCISFVAHMHLPRVRECVPHVRRTLSPNLCPDLDLPVLLCM